MLTALGNDSLRLGLQLTFKWIGSSAQLLQACPGHLTRAQLALNLSLLFQKERSRCLKRKANPASLSSGQAKNTEYRPGLEASVAR